jgi:hypothetical protein
MKTFLKAMLILLSAVLLFSVVGIGCQKTALAGVYVEENNSDLFLRIIDDGTFFTLSDVNGEWEVDGDEITLTTELGTATLRIKGNKLISEGRTTLFGDPKVFIKK